MSWSLGNKKWTIPFVSFNGTSCRIDIYQRGYTGSTVTELSTANANAPGVAATDPFYYEEDDDEDLLSVVRYKTGYINLVETTYGGLSELFPTKNNTLFVELYYGNQINFQGFIQAQSFENPWKPAPREISIPVISPLGLLDSIDMPVYNPPQAVSLAAQLADVLDALTSYCGVTYQGVTWPQLSTGLDATISSLVTSPFNGDHTPANDINLFSPITAEEFVEGLCNCFGWILHESATQIIFSMFDHLTYYNFVTPANLRTLSNVMQVPQTGADIVSLTDYVTPADNDGEESAVMPINKVTLEYQGEYVKSSKFDFNHLVYNGTSRDGNQYAAWLTLPTAPSPDRTPEISAGDYDRYLLPSNSFSNGKLVTEGVNPCSCGTRTDQKECLLVNLPQQGVSLGWIFTIKFYDRPTGSDMSIKWKSRWGDTILTLTDDEEVLHKKLGVVIKVGNLFYQGEGVWNTNTPSMLLDSGREITNTPTGLPIEVRFYEMTQTAVSHRVQTLTIEDLTLEELPTSYSNYTVVIPDEDIIENGEGEGEGETSVDMLITAYRKRSNMVGNNVVTRFTSYTYLMKSNVRWKIKFKKTANFPTLAYLVYMSFFSQMWRIISISEYPWNDEVIITLQRVID